MSPQPVDDFAFDDGGGGQGGGASETPLDWRRYFGAVLRRWWLIVLCASIATAGAGAYTVRQPKLFRAAAA
jgi:hypothetical protein